MSINPYRETPDRGSISAQILGGSAIIGGVSTMVKSVGLRSGVGFVVGAGMHYAGARTLMAGRRRKPRAGQPAPDHQYNAVHKVKK